MAIKVYCDRCDALIKEIKNTECCDLWSMFNSYGLILCNAHKKELADLENLISEDKKEKINDWKKKKVK